MQPTAPGEPVNTAAAALNHLGVYGRPFSATDLQVVQSGKVVDFDATKHWLSDHHKLLIFFPKAFTPVCGSEMGALQKWVDSFDKYQVQVIAATADPAESVAEWFNSEESLRSAEYPIFCSEILTRELGAAKVPPVQSGGTLPAVEAKRCSVWVMQTGEIVRQDYFENVGRSLGELNRQAYAYSTGEFCGEGWKNPESGFLKKAKTNGNTTTKRR